MQKHQLASFPIPMERHGEPGYLFQPQVQLTPDDIVLYSRVWAAWGERNLGGRPNVLKLVRKTAVYLPPNQRKQAVEHVMAYIDELAAVQLYAAKQAGTA